MSKKLLLVEDQAIIAMNQKRILEKNGFTVEVANDGENALRAVDVDPEISLVLMDIDLGTGMDGTQAAEYILQKRELPIIFLTSHTEKEYVDKVKKITGYGYVLKDAGEFVLIESIHIAFTLFEAKQEAQQHLADNKEAYRELEARETRLQHVNRVLHSIRNVNQIITEVSETDTLLDTACRILIETSGYHKAWIVRTANGVPVEPFYHSGFDSSFEPMEAELKDGRIPRCARKALEGHELVINEDPANECSDCVFQRQYAPDACGYGETVTMTVSLEYNGESFGWLSVILPTFHIDNPDEIHLFKEVAGDISFALHNIRMNEEKREAVEALRLSEENLRITLDSIGDAVIATDLEGRIARMNGVAERLTGWSKEEANGKPLGKIFYIINVDTGVRVEDPVNKVRRTGSIVGLANHTILVSRGGERYQIADSAAPIRNREEQITGVVLVFRDVTEEYRKSREIAESKEFLDAVMNSIQDGVSVLNSDLTIRYVNPVMQEWYGQGESLVGKKCYKMYHDRGEHCSACPSLRSMESGTTESEEVPGVPVAGAPVQWVEVFSYPLRDSSTGEITGVIEFVRDITERKSAEKRLEESEARWQFALEGARDGVWDWNAQTGEVYFSRQWKAMLGYTEEEIGNHVEEWESRIHPDDREQTIADLQAHLHGETEYYENEHRVRCKSGDYRWILDRGKVVERSKNGKALRVVGTHTDVTDQRLVRERLEKALEEKHNLIQELNHRVKNNLAMVSSLISLKDDKVGNSADLTDIKLQIDAIKTIHEKLYQSEEVTHIEVKDYLQKIVRTLFSTFSERRIEIESNIEELTVPTKTAIPLGLIVNEIGTNAIKHGFNELEEPRFSISFTRDASSGRYVLSLGNTGNPFPEEVDVHNTETLGLQLISTLVSQLKAEYRLQREPSPIFTFTIPMQE